ncbi:MAG: tetratricopeptide repeat protein [Syntrophobacteraceae bacterium]
MLASISSRVISRILLATSILTATLFNLDIVSAADHSYRQIALNMKQEIIKTTFQEKANKSTQNARSLYILGNRYLDSKDYDKAIASYQNVIYLDPYFAQNYYNLGMAHIAIGNRKEAAHYLTTFLNLKPDAFNAEEVRNLVRVLSK